MGNGNCQYCDTIINRNKHSEKDKVNMSIVIHQNKTPTRDMQWSEISTRVDENRE